MSEFFLKVAITLLITGVFAALLEATLHKVLPRVVSVLSNISSITLVTGVGFLLTALLLAVWSS